MSNEYLPRNPPSVPQSDMAEPPFDGSEGFDTILRTSDGMDFHVHRLVLSLSSTFFKSMFSLPQPPDASVPVIDVSEHSKAVDSLLRYCYPTMEPGMTDLNLVADVLAAAMKYEMTKATTVLTNRLRSFTEKNPLGVYTVACRLHLEEIASLAAVEWRKISPMSDDQAIGRGALVDWDKTICGSSYIDDMAGISAGAYYRLTQFVRTDKLTSFILPDSQESSSSGERNLKPTNPFSISDSDSDSDLTILSADGTQFYVHQLIIRLASPVLRKDIADRDVNDSLALPEDGETLSCLLQACYPSMTVGTTLDVQNLASCLRAAVKYEMVKVSESVSSLLKLKQQTEPLDVFFAFIANGFMKEGAEVAQTSLLFKPLSSLYNPLMETITAGFYYSWLKHRHGCLSSILKMCPCHYDRTSGADMINFPIRNGGMP